ncbi:hypothetical protein TRICI_006704 [Trichomonascus ciferrii]|uniref:Uncharacterized protein n=1 Tax=Trichomonascus ciferrii TaxID=44093 RepID=A0A642UEL6_9ASCO|nr:hypothetical protein TRICI_006704 [Trichomonascus ciferrii]
MSVNSINKRINTFNIIQNVIDINSNNNNNRINVHQIYILVFDANNDLQFHQQIQHPDSQHQITGHRFQT